MSRHHFRGFDTIRLQADFSHLAYHLAYGWFNIYGCFSAKPENRELGKILDLKIATVSKFIAKTISLTQGHTVLITVVIIKSAETEPITTLPVYRKTAII